MRIDSNRSSSLAGQDWSPSERLPGSVARLALPVSPVERGLFAPDFYPPEDFVDFSSGGPQQRLRPLFGQDSVDGLLARLMVGHDRALLAALAPAGRAPLQGRDEVVPRQGAAELRPEIRAGLRAFTHPGDGVDRPA